MMKRILSALGRLVTRLVQRFASDNPHNKYERIAFDAFRDMAAALGRAA